MNELPADPAVEEPHVERLPHRSEDASELTAGRRRAALGIAMVADAIEWVAFPIFMWGAASTANDVLDIAVALILIRMIGFHWALLPAFVSELVPFVGLVPTWTAAVWLATRGKNERPIGKRP